MTPFKSIRSICPLCNRDILLNNFSKHHLVPRSCGGKATASICNTCHQQIHLLFSNKKLERELGSIEDLKNNKEVQKYIKWIRNKNPDQKIPGKLHKRNRGR